MATVALDTSIGSPISARGPASAIASNLELDQASLTPLRSTNLFRDGVSRHNILENRPYAFFIHCQEDAQETRKAIQNFIGSCKSLLTRKDPVLINHLINKTLPDLITGVQELRENLCHLPRHNKDWDRFAAQHELLQGKLAQGYESLNNDAVRPYLKELVWAANTYLIFIETLVSGYDVQKYKIDGFHYQTRGPLNISFECLCQMTGAEGMLLDVDDCMAWTEHRQLPRWHDAIDTWQAIIARADPKIFDELRRIVKNCFENDNTSILLASLHSYAKENNVLPKDVSDDPSIGILQLDHFLTKHRSDLLLEDVRSGEITLTDGLVRYLTKARMHQKLVGICTSSPRGTSEPILRLLFQKEGLNFDYFVEPQHRTYGDEVPIRKPHIIQWLIGAQRLGIEPDKLIMMDNSRNNVTHVAEMSDRYQDDPLVKNLYPDSLPNFAAVVGVVNCGPRHIKEWSKWRDWLAARPNNKPISVLLKQFENVI